MTISDVTFQLCVLLILSIPYVLGDCQSYGVDYVNGGSYFCNTGSQDYFNFTSFFEGKIRFPRPSSSTTDKNHFILGCEPGEDAYTVLTLPNTDYDYCSTLPTTPNDTYVTAVCNVESFELKKSDLVSGEYIIQLIGNNANGDPFAWQRNVYITAGTQVTLTATPTVTFTITTTPEITITSTEIDTFTNSLLPLTTTMPSKTLKATITVTPSKVTVYSTSTVTKAQTTRTFSVVETTTSVPPPCITWPPPPDVPCTALPPGLQNPMLASVVSAAAAVETAAQKREPRPVVDKLAYRKYLRREDEIARRGLARRSPDQRTVVVVETTSIVSLTSTVTAPPILDTETTTINTTVTYTPPVVTVYSGKTQITVTAPTPTKTSTVKVKTTVLTTKTVLATNTLTLTTGNPYPCSSGAPGGGSGPHHHGPQGPYAGVNAGFHG